MKHKYILPPQTKTNFSSEANEDQKSNAFIFPPFFRLTTSYFPKSESDNANKFPVGVSIMPGMLDNVPVVDYRNKYVVHCTVCHGYLSANCVIVPERKAWICALCGNMTTLPKDYDINTGVETHSAVYDMIMNDQSHIPGKEEKKFLKMFAISIDISNSTFCQLFAKSVKKALLQIQDESVVICLFSSGQNVTYFDPGRQKAFVISDFDNFQLPPFQFLPFSETKSFLLKSIDDIINLSKLASNSNLINSNSNFRNIIKLGQEFLKEFGGIFIISLFSLPSDINPMNSKDNPFVMPKDQSDLLDLGFSLNSRSISVHLFHQFDPSIQNSQFIVTDTIAGLTNGSTYVVNTNFYPITSSLNKNENNNSSSNDNDLLIPDDLILQSKLLRILTSNYFWKSFCVLRSHPEISRSSYLGNCVIRRNGVCTLGAFPMTPSSSVSFELSFPRNSAILQNRDKIGVQFAMMFIDGKEGLQVNRVISYLVDIGNDSGKIIDESHVDVAAVTSIVAKLALKKMRDNDMESALNFVRQNERFCFDGIFNACQLFVKGKGSSGFERDVAASDSIFIYGASVNELILFLIPRIVKRSNSSWKQTNMAVFIIPEKGKEEEVKQSIFGNLESDEKRDFANFYEECKLFIGWNQPVIFLCD